MSSLKKGKTTGRKIVLIHVRKVCCSMKRKAAFFFFMYSQVFCKSPFICFQEWKTAYVCLKYTVLKSPIICVLLAKYHWRKKISMSLLWYFIQLSISFFAFFHISCLHLSGWFPFVLLMTVILKKIYFLKWGEIFKE